MNDRGLLVVVVIVKECYMQEAQLASAGVQLRGGGRKGEERQEKIEENGSEGG